MDNKKLTIGIFADVDAGKTTLSESILYLSGAVRKRGRVDTGDAFLDTHELEKQRGITIFSKQAVFDFGNTHFYLVDTPGHADFAAEAERAVSILDAAVLLVSAADGAAAHTELLWKLLKAKKVPTLVFVNKTDLAGFDKQTLIKQLHRRLSDKLCDFTLPDDERIEAAAFCSDSLIESYDKNGTLTAAELSRAVMGRELFPMYFGAALKDQGVSELLSALDCYIKPQPPQEEFSARVFKIERDADGKRMTCVKLTGGSLKVRQTLKYRGASGVPIEEKLARIRIYSGGKFTEVDKAEQGDVVSLLGLTSTYAGQGLGSRTDSLSGKLRPVISCAVYPPSGTDNFTLLSKLYELREEDPALEVGFNERLGEITLGLMGEMQTEIIKSEMKRRFGLEITVGEGRIMYKETIAEPVEGCGHFEPLRHYAEVHLILSPLPQGSGIVFDTAVSEDLLDRNWQNLIISSLKSKEHIGVLTGSPITDMKITLSAGRAHPKHTEGGDFREAAWRAVRQGLMKGKSVLLEPYFSFRLTVPTEQLGRAMSDLDFMGAEMSQPEEESGMSVISGKAPAAKLRSYSSEVAAFTKGHGSLSLENAGYAPCRNADEVIAECGYDAEADLANTADSVFCSHGSGDVVNWAEADEKMHLSSTLVKGRAAEPHERRAYSLGEDELERIMQKIAPKRVITNNDEERNREAAEIKKRQAAKSKPDTRPRLLLVDGYNIVFAWEELRSLASVNIDSACGKLADILSNYAGFKGLDLMLVFDAYKTPAVTPQKIRAEAIEVIYTASGQTSDAFIESYCSENRTKKRIKVASSDGLVQMSIMRTGALRMSASELKAEVESAEASISDIISRNNT